MIIAHLSCSWECCREIQWRRETCDFQEKIVSASKDSWFRNNYSMMCQENSWRSSTICSWNTWKVGWKEEKWLFLHFPFHDGQDLPKTSSFFPPLLFFLTFGTLDQVPETMKLSKDIVSQVPLLHLPHLLTKPPICVGPFRGPINKLRGNWGNLVKQETRGS